MPRSIWNGTIAIGLLTVPVKVHTATDDKTVHLEIEPPEPGDEPEEDDDDLAATLEASLG